MAAIIKRKKVYSVVYNSTDENKGRKPGTVLRRRN